MRKLGKLGRYLKDLQLRGGDRIYETWIRFC